MSDIVRSLRSLDLGHQPCTESWAAALDAHKLWLPCLLKKIKNLMQDRLSNKQQMYDITTRKTISTFQYTDIQISVQW